ncbi:uncharacterized protein LOC135399767 [Ornithodoros turicata]|uniref:uncharacterized protein LOC135399767 n=1 Tax=Ornithodoros turicata TaxID=34597 RepID=UPI00313A04D8
MAIFYVLLGFLATGVLAGSKYESNSYFDTVLRNYLPHNIRARRLDPLTVRDMDVTVPGSLLRHDFKAKFTNGSMFGLSTVVRRLGDCSAPGWMAGNITVGCYMSVNGLNVHYNVSSKGDTISNEKKKYTADITTKNTTVFVEVTQRKPRAASLKTFSVRKMALDVALSKRLDLNHNRMQDFVTTINRTVQRTVSDVLYDSLKNALDVSVRALHLPEP